MTSQPLHSPPHAAPSILRRTPCRTALPLLPSAILLRLRSLLTSQWLLEASTHCLPRICRPVCTVTVTLSRHSALVSIVANGFLMAVSEQVTRRSHLSESPPITTSLLTNMFGEQGPTGAYIMLLYWVWHDFRLCWFWSWDRQYRHVYITRTGAAECLWEHHKGRGYSYIII